MNRRNCVAILLIALLIAAIPLSSACGGKDKNAPPPQEVILEPGLTSGEPDAAAQADTPEPTEEEPSDPADLSEGDFIDLGRASTLNDLMANKERIRSYYFEQTQDDIFIRTWYADGWMKIILSFADGEEETEYIDCENRILVSYMPAVGDYGILETFAEGDPNLPVNHLNNDYHEFRVVDTDNIEGQVCRVLEGRQGEKLWVSTKYGFPLQVEFIDPTNGKQYIVPYENLTLNQVLYEDVIIPEDLDIYQY